VRSEINSPDRAGSYCIACSTAERMTLVNIKLLGADSEK
jgi:hypothetical protein